MENIFPHCVKNHDDTSKIPQMIPPYNPKTKSPSFCRSFFGAHPSKSCGISGQDTSFLFCLCVYLPINAAWCFDSQRIASSLTLYGMYPPHSLASCPLNESMHIHHQNGRKSCYVHNCCVYISTSSSHLPHTP